LRNPYVSRKSRAGGLESSVRGKLNASAAGTTATRWERPPLTPTCVIDACATSVETETVSQRDPGTFPAAEGNGHDDLLKQAPLLAIVILVVLPTRSPRHLGDHHHDPLSPSR
jgi:hypothetical protein